MKDLGDTFFVLGIKIHWDRSLSRKSYIETIFKRYGMQDCKPSDIPIAKGDKFSPSQWPKNDFEEKEIEKVPYTSAVGSLMYAQV